jgi:hypothetical protein
MLSDAPAGFYALGALGALLMYAAIIAFVTGQRHRKTRYYQRDSNQHESKSDDGTNRFTAVEKQDTPTDSEDQNSYNLERDRYDFITLGIGLVGLIVVIYYTTINYWLYSVTKESLVDVQRAYVVYTGLSPFGFLDVRNKRTPTVQINPVWANTGKTPTKNLRIYVSTPKEIVAPYKASDLNFRKEADVTYTQLYIAPGLTVHGGGKTLSLDDLHAIRDGKKQMYVWGCAWYDDVFPRTAHHVTEFCDVIDAAYFDPKDETKPTAVGTDFCSVHNCADDECADKCE